MCILGYILTTDLDIMAKRDEILAYLYDKDPDGLKSVEIEHFFKEIERSAAEAMLEDMKRVNLLSDFEVKYDPGKIQQLPNSNNLGYFTRTIFRATIGQTGIDKVESKLSK